MPHSPACCPRCWVKCESCWARSDVLRCSLTVGAGVPNCFASRWDLRAIVLAYRMFERWRQENFFKYVREEFLIYALGDYEIEPDDANRSVPNPPRKAIEKELRRMPVQLAKLRANYAAITLEA